MKEVREEIAADKYAELGQMSYKERANIIEKDVPSHWFMGCGYYGHRLEEEEGRFYIVHKIG